MSGIMDPRIKRELDELLYLAIENVATAEQIDTLNRLIESDTDVREYVSDYYDVVSILRNPSFFGHLPHSSKEVS